MIFKCKCQHEQQDNLHGKGNRVMNATAKDQFRCTVCGDTVSRGSPTKKGKR